MGGTCLGVCVDKWYTSRCACGWVEHAQRYVWINSTHLDVRVDGWNMSGCMCG